MLWGIEEIPDEDGLYRRVPKADRHPHTGELVLGTFRFNPDLSTHWNRYASPEDARKGATKPANNGVMTLDVRRIRDIGLRVAHTPEDEDRSHTSVWLQDRISKEQARLLLMRAITDWPIPIPT